MSDLSLKEMTEFMSTAGMQTVIVDEEGFHEVEPSPFIPGTKLQYAWDSTSLGWLKTCPRLYYYNMIERWRPNEDNDNLRFGIEYHKALQDYDHTRNQSIPHDDAVYDVVKALLERIADWHPHNKYKNRYNLIRTVVWRLDHYRDNAAKVYIRKDGTPAREVSFRFAVDHEVKGYQFVVCGHLDNVVEYNEDLFVKDDKTGTSTPGEYYFKQYDVHNQMSLYTLAGEIVLNTPIKGVIIDYAQVAVGFSRFTRGMTYRTKDQLAEWLYDLSYWFKQAQEFAERDYWPMRDTACNMYGGCRFLGICSKSPHVRGQFLKTNFTQGEQWNPLKTR